MELDILFTVIILTIVPPPLHATCSNHWDYSRCGPDVWSKSYSSCGGQSQSPINIRTACAVLENFEPFRLSDIYQETLNFQLKNNGHTITGSTSKEIPLSGGKLNGNYRFTGFHIHWGPNENTGSEHQVNGMKYTGESHFVYENVITKQRAVLGFLMKDEGSQVKKGNVNPTQREKDTTDQWKKYFDATIALVKENDTTSIDLNLALLMGNSLEDFWRYNGSLTTPPCSENVIWTIFKEPIKIFDYEFDSVRHDLFYESYRGPQPLYYRTIYRSFKDEIVTTIPDEKICIGGKSNANSIFINHHLLYFIIISTFILIFISYH